jgi:miniconductance mechanosensitive channel
MNFQGLQSWLLQHEFWSEMLTFVIIILGSWVSFFITRKIILTSITKILRKTTTHLDDVLIERKFFHRIAFFAPIIIVFNFAYMLPEFSTILQRASLGSMVVVAIFAIQAFLSAVSDIYSQSKYAEQVHIKGYIQVVKLILTILGVILFAAVISGRSPIYLLSGVGALTAVLMLVFKDTILSLVASIQINSNELMKVGDWVEAPQFGADGDVIDIALHTVKIQNWDKTITVIPTHKLIDSSFKNWKGMSQSGGRRIKRCINLDMSSIKFVDENLLSKFMNFELIQNYLNEKSKDIKQHNESQNINTNERINVRRLTNIGTFRAYLKEYLKQNKSIHGSMTFLVRQLEPTQHGLPLQVYVFTNDTDWIRYEDIQSDIFDHILAVLPEFELKIFQHPTGHDFQQLK